MNRATAIGLVFVVVDLIFLLVVLISERRRRAANPFAPPMNVFALVGFFGVMVTGVPGIVFSHIALAQIKRTQEYGRQFAIAGLIMGYLQVAAVVALVVAVVVSYALYRSSTVSE